MTTRVRCAKCLIPLVFLVGLFASAIIPSPARPARPVLAAANPVVTENQQTSGVSTAWQGTGAAVDDTTQQIKGYASATSVAQGGSITLFVTANPAQTYTIDFYRIGWYLSLIHI